jgi:RNA polymerase sigma-70 factor (ECF subfamily)
VSDDFRTTRWSVVLAAGTPDAPGARAALETLCGAYWYPLYAYARRRGQDRESAADRVQSFFAELLEKNRVARANPDRGRFRAFLLVAFRRHLTREREHDRAQKRGGGRAPLPLDFETGERRYSREPGHDETPERLFDRRFALTLLERVLRAVRREMEAEGKGASFEALKPAIGGAGELPPYAELAARLGLSEGGVKSAVRRLRTRYRERLRAEIAETVSSPAEVDAEIAHLIDALRK